MTHTVLLVDDHDLIRQGLARAFERHEDFKVLGEAGNVSEGCTSCADDEAHSVATDVRLPDGSGLDLVRALRVTDDSIGIVVLTMYAGDQQLFEALEAGASVRGETPPRMMLLQRLGMPPSRRAHSLR